MAKKYIFLDIDGTLYSPKLGRIPESALEAVRLVRENGHKIFLCTGRSLAEVSKYLNYDVNGFIMGAGAEVYAEGRPVFDHPIPEGDIIRIKKVLRSFGLGYSLEGSAGAYCNPKGYERLLWYFSGGEKDKEKRTALAMENCAYPEKFGSEENDKIYKITVFGNQWEPIFPKLEKELEAPYILTKAMELVEDHFCIGEITNGNITKAEGIDRILEHYNAQTFDAIGIGDSANDIPMLKKCSIGIAMGNASPETIAAADYVTTDILDDGIMNAFRHFELI